MRRILVEINILLAAMKLEASSEEAMRTFSMHSEEQTRADDRMVCMPFSCPASKEYKMNVDSLLLEFNCV